MKRITWRSEWNSPFLSPWGLFERVRFANCASGRDLIDVFGAPTAKEHPLRKNSRTFASPLDWIDRPILGDVFGGAVLENYLKFIQVYVRPLVQANTSVAEILRKDLAFCPECMNIGYHSYFHQLSFLHSCPYHGRPLLKKCPGCGGTISYELSIRNGIPAFSCKCGYSLYYPRQIPFMETWRQANTITLPHELALWGNSPSQHDIAENCSLSIDYFIKKEAISGFSLYTRLLDISSLSSPRPWTIYSTWPPYCMLKSEEENLRDENYAYNYLRPIYKSLLRRLKKTVMYKHRHCLNQYTKPWKIPLSECHYAIAYARLRQEMEGLESPQHVERCKVVYKGTLSVPPWLDIQTLFATLEHKHLVDYPTIQIGKFKSSPRPIAMWIMSHKLGNTVFSKFNDWLEYITKSSIEGREDQLCYAVKAKACPNIEANETPYVITIKKLGDTIHIQYELLAKRRDPNTDFCLSDDTSHSNMTEWGRK